jgi:hypothetical protein
LEHDAVPTKRLNITINRIFHDVTRKAIEDANFTDTGFVPLMLAPSIQL